MKLLRQTLLEMLTLAAVGLVLASASNGLRAKGALSLGKNYFYIAEASPSLTAESAPQRAAVSTEGNDAPDGTNATSTAGSSSADDTAPAAATGSPEHAKHGFQEIDYAGVVQIMNDPDTESGLNVFVDARNDHNFEEGHIPGALQCDHYNIDEYWDAVEPAVMGAMKVVVYCGGGDCIDSILMCQDLTYKGVPKDAIYLYAGGWQEWSAKQGPVETGRNE